MPSEAVQVLFRIVDILEQESIPYAIGGSFASGLFGESRPTHDVDILIHLSPSGIPALVRDLTPEFFVHPDDVRDAVASHRSFNAIHKRSHLKVDLFVSGDGLLDQEQLERRIPSPIDPDEPRMVLVTSPEIIVLRKLDEYRMTDGTSDRQWRDVLGVLKASSASMDLAYAERTAARLGLDGLLARALAEAGISPLPEQREVARDLPGESQLTLRLPNDPLQPPSVSPDSPANALLTPAGELVPGLALIQVHVAGEGATSGDQGTFQGHPARILRTVA